MNLHKTIQIQLTPSEAKDFEFIQSYLLKNGFIKQNQYFKITKRSVDARKKQIKINLTFLISDNPLPTFDFDFYDFQNVSNKSKIHIIGAGPAGIFAALEAILLGYKPILIEQGKKINERRRDLVKIIRQGNVSETSNYCFGEGGAGTYSDGKLYTRSNKRGNVRKILELLVQHGADSSILTEAHPHIGTNKLPQIIESIRETILSCGGEFLFETQLIDFEITNNKINSLVLIELKTNKTIKIKVENVILATGHSGRSVFELLYKKHIKIEAKPFAIGVRIEHPQMLIDSIQYHCKINEMESIREFLPASAYNLVTQVNGRGVYSFCMCPGGIIAPCATKNGEVVTNGWSPSKRNNPFANSGIVVETTEKDWVDFGAFGELKAMKFQEFVEQKMFNANQPQFAPAQRMMDFIENKKSINLPQCSYKPGIYLASLHQLLPKFMVESLQIGLQDFGKKMRGYLTNEAVLVAIESRTSSPVRIPRDKEKLHHTEIKNLYPCAEGAGFAGGIVSAAIDGQRCVKSIFSEVIR
jgi:uncharacterized protein